MHLNQPFDTNTSIHSTPVGTPYLLPVGLEEREDLADYRDRGGYEALGKILGSDNGVDLIEMLTQAGLTGRGGANFPTGKKWAMVSSSPSMRRFVVCNGGEHEPGSYKDRELLRRRPHQVLEGLLLAAKAVGALAAYVYLTQDQARTRDSVALALEELHGADLLRALSDGGFDCPIRLVAGPATYVAGEETAMLSFLEGDEAKPRAKPPFPTVEGFEGAPTLVNNVETLANVPNILLRGADWFRANQTQLVTLSRGVIRPGVYEIPVGTTLRFIIDHCGGGTVGGRAVKAILPGGPSLPFLDGASLDIPFRNSDLREAGSGTGCGAMRVWLEDECMVEPILGIARFFAGEQCGQCPPCRMETSSLVKVLEQIANGQGRKAHLLQVAKCTAFAKSKGGLCSLIHMAAAPVVSALELFPEDFLYHIERGGCPQSLRDENMETSDRMR